jgi:hypothetical protein
MRLRFLLLIIAFPFLSACTQSLGAYEQVEGSPFYTKPVESFVENKTRKDEVLKEMGEPYLAVTWQDGSETLKYRSVRERVCSDTILGFATRVDITRAHESMIFTFRNGLLVTKYSEFFVSYSP